MSCLYITTEEQLGQTAISECYFTQPFKIAKPFITAQATQIMIMTATAGIMKDDYYDIKVIAGEHTKTIITNQSYSKVFDTLDGQAKQKQAIRVMENAELAWLMQPMIPYKNSSFESDTLIEIERGAKLFYLDVLAGGRIGMGERFSFKKYHGRTFVLNPDKRPVFLDNILLEPDKAKIQGMGYFESWTHMGMIYLYGYEDFELPECEDIEVVKTKAKEGLVIRMLGSSGDSLYEYAQHLYRIL